MTETPNAPLRREIDSLGRSFGEVIRRFAGAANFDLVENVRTLARDFREGNAAAGEQLRTVLAGLGLVQLEIVIRAFSIFLELANLAEDRQRVRVLRDRERESFPQPRRESIRDAIHAYHNRGLSTGEVQKLVDRTQIELVLTAHPTEAKRRSLRRILRRLNAALDQLEGADLTPSIERQWSSTITSELEILWQTDLLRPFRPTPLQEVERGLAFQAVLWDGVPTVLNELREALAESYPKVREPGGPMIRYASWIGGDRDGNPFVTPDITRETLVMSRRAAVDKHIAACRLVSWSLSISERQTPASAALSDAIAAAGQRWPELGAELEGVAPLETYRRWLFVVHWRLRQTRRVSLDADKAELPAGAYATADDLHADVQLVADALRATGNATTLAIEVQPWLDQIRVFGFHIARLDVRQHSAIYRDAFTELWQANEMAGDPGQLDEPAREKVLADTLDQAAAVKLEGLSDSTAEMFEMFRVLRRTARRFGMAALGEHVISMTKQPSDVLGVLWCWRWSESVDGGDPHDRDMLLPVAPLFETIGDLRDAARTLRVLLETPAYREHVRALGDRQTVMIGYSDSTKDGGYMAAQWALYTAQRELQQVADDFGVRLMFFHGRGGSLGRGGGPAARGILSLPTTAFSGSLRLTEQGETLAERYDNPEIAHRHLEQVGWSMLTAASRRPAAGPPAWSDTMQAFSTASFDAYRRLVDHDAFGDFFRRVTPVNEIERLPMGSRPAKRKSTNRIEDLRAIPWVFSWTQCRCLIPAWYGLGAGYEQLVDANNEHAELLQTMYRQWSFFAAAIDNAALAIAKSDMRVFREYARLGADTAAFGQLAEMIVAEHERSRRATLAILNSSQLLDDVPWLQRSIQVRNSYVDPLNLIQAELLGRRAKHTGDDADKQRLAELEHLALLTIKGVSAGMRSTG
jgi:phosphoenolpyruvate carboxylase